MFFSMLVIYLAKKSEQSKTRIFSSIPAFFEDYKFDWAL